MSNTPKPHNLRRRSKPSAALEKKAPEVTLKQLDNALAALAKLETDAKKGPTAILITKSKNCFFATLVKNRVYVSLGDGKVPDLDLGPTGRAATALDALGTLANA